MPTRRDVSDDFHDRPHTRDLSSGAIHLNFYLFTNPHTGRAGLYYIALDTLAHGIKRPEEEIPGFLKEIEDVGRIKWWQEDGLIWVKNFIKRNIKSDTWLKGVATDLKGVGNKDAVQELLDYYLTEYPDIGTKLASFYGMEASSKYEPTAKDEIDIDGLMDKELKELCLYHKSKPSLGIVTPAVKDALQLMLKEFKGKAVEWFRYAYEDAVFYSKKPGLSYIVTIMRRWATEGRGDEEKTKKLFKRGLEPSPAAEKIWKEVLAELREQVTRSYYRTWLEKTVGVSHADNVFTVGVPQPFVALYLDQNQRSLIEKCLINVVGKRDIEFEFGILKGAEEEDE